MDDDADVTVLEDELGHGVGTGLGEVVRPAVAHELTGARAFGPLRLEAPDGRLMLTGATDMLSDPQVLFDVRSNRFYYLIIRTADDTFAWGFSRSSNPTTLPGGN